jgi:tetratricopeptide (TPR) repeat protein
MPMKELFSWKGGETITSGARGHLTGWLLYHWLWNYRSKEFSDYQKRLADSGDHELAWRKAFPDLDPATPESIERLEIALARYRTSGRFTAFKVDAEFDGRFSEAKLSSSDLHLLLLGSRRNWPSEKDRADAARRAIVDEALAEDPGSPAALAAQMGLDDKVDPAKLRAAAIARPGDWRGWMVSTKSGTEAEREADLRKAVQLNPDNAFAQNQLAWLLVSSNRAREALPIANRALDLAPWNASIIDTLAEVAARMGKCSEARQLEKRALTIEQTDHMRARQAEIERTCATGVSTSGAR